MLCCCSSTGVLVQPSASSGAMAKCFLSECFGITRGVRQGGMLSPYLFKLYVRDLLKVVVGSNTGCNIAGCLINILAYADDMVLILCRTNEKGKKICKSSLVVKIYAVTGNRHNRLKHFVD